MLVITAALGACFIAIRYGLSDAPVLWFASLRALLAGAVLLAVGHALRRPSPPHLSWPDIALLALVNVTFVFAAMFAGTAGVATGVAAVLTNTQPLLIVLPAWAIYRERPSTRGLAGLLVGFTGLVVTASPGGLGGGVALSLAAAAATTAGTLLARRLDGLDLIVLFGWQFVVGGVLLAAWAGSVEGVPAISWTSRFVAAMLFLALINSAASNLLWFIELQRSPLLTLITWTLLAPVFGVALGWLLLGERLSVRQLIGSALVLGALVVGLPWRHSAVRPHPRLGPVHRRHLPARP